MSKKAVFLLAMQCYSVSADTNRKLICFYVRYHGGLGGHVAMNAKINIHNSALLLPQGALIRVLVQSFILLNHGSVHSFKECFFMLHVPFSS